jgi:hypothetical protein
MIKKIVRLTESDLIRLVNKVVKEQSEGPFAHHKDTGWYDAGDRAVEEPTDYSEEREFGPGEYDDFMEFINNCNHKWCLQTKRFYDTYASRGKIKVRK